MRAPLSTELKQIIAQPAWKRLRLLIARRENFRCKACGCFTGMHGQADHIVPRRDCEARGISPWDPENLQWLCRPCHSQKSNAERWAGHVSTRGERPRRRRNPDRAAFMRAAGIPP